MSRPELVVGVGASAGGVEALMELVGALPAGFPAPVLVVLHIAPAGTSVLPSILDRRTPLAVAAAADGVPLEPGHVYVAPPDQHLVVADGAVVLNREPRENGHRPAVDPTFRSLADAYGSHAAGVILSGSRDDGSRGLAAIKAANGHAFVQDPDTCLYTGMPNSAIRATPVDAVLPIAAIAERLAALTGNGDPVAPVNGNGDPEPAPVRPTRLVCPDCGGVLSQTLEHGAETYRCSIGHAFSPDSLQEEQARLLESALWAAVRTLEDRQILLNRLAARAIERGESASHASFERQARDATRRADLIRAVVADSAPTTHGD